jgi:RimJ/RimL family protein N-acetyltransferase|tara:strand:- start:4378 stop:4941 length:564 start_codon:yes stop_codon:yes gene_type:complete
MIDLAKPPPYTKDDSILLRPYAMEDTDRLYEAAKESIDEVYPFLPWCHPDYVREESEEWITSCIKRWDKGAVFNFAIFELSDLTFLGGCGLDLLGSGNCRANLGYWVRTSATGRGIATRATKLLIAYGFKHLALRRIEILMATHNHASRKVAVNAGASFEGTLRNRLVIDDVSYDTYSYAVIPSDFA